MFSVLLDCVEESVPTSVVRVETDDRGPGLGFEILVDRESVAHQRVSTKVHFGFLEVLFYGASD